jgi:hypothetical protein
MKKSAVYGVVTGWVAVLAYRLIWDPAYGTPSDWASIAVLWALSVGLIAIAAIRVVTYLGDRVEVKRGGGQFWTVQLAKRTVAIGWGFAVVFRIYTLNMGGTPAAAISIAVFWMSTIALIAVLAYERRASRRDSDSHATGGS